VTKCLSSAAVSKFCFSFLVSCCTIDDRGNSEPSTQLYVGNLNYTMSESALMEAFDGCVSAYIMFDEK